MYLKHLGVDSVKHNNLVQEPIIPLFTLQVLQPSFQLTQSIGISLCIISVGVIGNSTLYSLHSFVNSVFIVLPSILIIAE